MINDNNKKYREIKNKGNTTNYNFYKKQTRKETKMITII